MTRVKNSYSTKHVKISQKFNLQKHHQEADFCQEVPQRSRRVKVRVKDLEHEHKVK